MNSKEEEKETHCFGIHDLFGLKASFNFRGHSTSRSACGVCSTILFALFSLWTLYHVGKDMIYREHPTTVESTIFVEDPGEILVSPDTFIFGFGLERPDNFAHYIDSSIYTVKAVHFNQKRITDSNGNVQLNATITDLELEVCTPEYFGSMTKEFSVLELNQMFCIKKNQPGLDKLSIKGKFEVEEVSFLRMSFHVCNNATSGGTCAPQADIDELLEGSYFAVYYSDISIKPENFSIPQKRFMDAQFTTFGQKYYKEYQIWVNHINLDSDQGWLFEDHIEKVLHGFGFAKELIDFRGAGDKFFEFQLRASPFYKYYSRSYIKLQDVLGNAQGLITFFVVFVAVAVFPYVKVKFYEDLVNEVFDIHLYRPNDTHDDDKSKNDKDDHHEDKKLLPPQHVKDKSDENKREMVSIPMTPIKNQSEYQDLSIPPDLTPLNSGNGSSPQSGKPKAYKPSNFTLDLDRVSNLENNTTPSSFKGQSLSIYEKKAAHKKKTLKQQTLSLKESSSSSKMISSFSNRLLNQAPESEKIYAKDAGNQSNFDCNTLTTERKRPLDISDILEDKDEDLSKSPQPSALNTPKGDQELLPSHLKQNPQLRNVHNKELNRTRTYSNSMMKPSETLHKPEIKMLEDYGDVDEDELYRTLILKEEEKMTRKQKIEKSLSGLQRVEEERIHITVFDYLRSYFSNSPTLKKKIEMIKEGKRRIKERLDVFNVMKKLREIDKLKALLLDQHQLMLFDHLPKPVLEMESREYLDGKLSESHAVLRSPEIVQKMRHALLMNSVHHIENRQTKTPIDEKLLNIYNELLN